MRGIERIVRGRLHYGWIVAGVTFLTLLASAGIRSTPGILIIPLEKEFGWTRATVSLAVSINLLLYGLFGPFSAALMDRIGARRVMLFALTLVAAGVGLTTLMRAAWQLVLLWGVVVGLGTGTMALVLGAYIANRWFSERRGIVMGLLTASTATGQLLFLPFLASLVVASGWRAAVLAVAGVALLIVPVVYIFMRNDPSDVGLRPFGATADAGPVSSTANPATAALAGLREGSRSRDFWLLVGSFFICGASTNGLIGTHLIPASMEHGIPEVTAAGLLAAIGVFDLIGTTVSGWLSDRWDNRYLLCWYYGLRGLSLLYLPYALGTQFVGLAAFAVFYGLDWVATVPPTVRLTADIFGRQKVGVMYGWISAGHQLGAATAAFGAGAVRSWLGSYQVAFMTSGLLCLIASGLVIRIGQASGGLRRARPVEAGASV
ncbi:MAG: MFS transporter [Bacillati bacterium ANGP1]|uniref:MFS transporter n=1 Tax=Candidatus Segetimicrobium genomatis TaxID=2569760 RepID=A0A537JIU1_9BACT|nr:MAG: MFS transporter [Terrabacteria group bacterium ANGP1]